MDNKPKMYKGTGVKMFNNNRSVYASYENNKDEVIARVDKLCKKYPLYE